MKVIDGSIILRIAEEKDETSFIDELYVIVNGMKIRPEAGSRAAARVTARDGDRLMIAAGQSYEFAFALSKSLAGREHVEVSVVAAGFYASE